MPDGILDQRLEDELGHHRLLNVGGSGNGDFQSVRKAKLLDLEVAPDEVQLLVERHLLVGHVVERHLVERHLVERHLVERHLVVGHLVERDVVVGHLVVRYLVVGYELVERGNLSLR